MLQRMEAVFITEDPMKWLNECVANGTFENRKEGIKFAVAFLKELASTGKSDKEHYLGGLPIRRDDINPKYIPLNHKTFFELSCKGVPFFKKDIKNTGRKIKTVKGDNFEAEKKFAKELTDFYVWMIDNEIGDCDETKVIFCRMQLFNATERIMWGVLREDKSIPECIEIEKKSHQESRKAPIKEEE